jgi:replicative DNA helicase
MTTPIPPHDVAAERSIMGQAIMEPEHTDKILKKIKPEYLFRTQHQRILEAVVSIRKSGQTVTMIGVHDWLIQSGVLNAGNGKAAAYLSEICLLSSPFFFEREIEIVIRTYHQRRHIALANRLLESAWLPCVSHDDLKQVVFDGFKAYESLFGEVYPNAKLPVR